MADMISAYSLFAPILLLLVSLGITLLGLKIKIPLVTLIGSLFSWLVFIDTVMTESGKDYILPLLMLPLTSMIIALVSFSRR